MKKSKMMLLISSCLIISLMLFFQFPANCYSFEITIDVAPNVLNIQSQGEVVTVHTNIAYSAVDGASVTINDVEIAWWKSDNCGYFVAKFLMKDIETLPLLIDEYNTLELVGVTKDEEEFYGSQEIKVVNVLPSGSSFK